jgi:hypothetical protein
MNRYLKIAIFTLVITLSFLNIAFFIYYLRSDIFWDLAVYHKAVDNYNNNINPYSVDQGLLFIYHPLTLYFFRYFGNNNLSIELGFFYILSILMVVVSLWYEDKKELLLSVSFGGLGLTSIASGNVTTFLHLFLLALLLKEVRDDRFFLSYPVIIVISLIKPYFMAYLFVQFFIDQGKLKNAIVLWLICFLIYFAVVILYQILYPGIVNNFYTALHYQIITKGDIGYSFFYLALIITNRGDISIFLHLLISIGLIIILYIIRFKWFGVNLSRVNILYLTYFVLTIINPRMKEYDLFPALLSLFLFGKNILGETFSKYYLASLTVVSVPIFVEIGKKLWNINPSIYLMNNWLWEWGSILVFLAAIVLNKKLIRLLP